MSETLLFDAVEVAYNFLGALPQVREN